VDGSSAQTNPENRGFGNYGGQNQIEILSVEAVAEVQVAKGSCRRSTAARSAARST
jgi:hypothetical protein